MTHFCRLLSVIVACSAFLISSPPAQARNIFETIFGPPVKAQKHRAYSGRRGVRPRLARRALTVKQVEARIARAYSVRRGTRLVMPHRRAAAKRVGIPVVQQEPKPARAMSDAELVASIMADPTLRRGDVVEFPDGPRVYSGNGRFSSHSLSDFEDAQEAGLVGPGVPGAGLTSSGTVYSGAAAALGSRQTPVSTVGDIAVTSSVPRAR